MINQEDLEELMIYVLGLEKDSDILDIEDAIYDTYDCNLETITYLLEDLFPLIDTGKSPITNKFYRGFSKQVGKHKEWIIKQEIKNE